MGMVEPCDYGTRVPKTYVEIQVPPSHATLIDRVPASQICRPFSKPRHPGSPAIRSFRRACLDGDLEQVSAAVLDKELPPEVLTWGLNGALSQGRLEVTYFLLQHGAKLDGISSFSAAQSRYKPLFELLLKCGWDPNEASPKGWVALPSVVGDEDLVRLLLDHGANPNLGAPRPDPELERPCPPNCKSGEALNNAASRCKPAVFQLLLDRGAKLENAWPLHKAASVSHPESITMMQYLVSIGCDINMYDSDVDEGAWSATPLHYAVKHEAVEQAQWLLENGCDMNKKDYSGWTPLELAGKLGCGKTKMILKSWAANRQCNDIDAVVSDTNDA